MTPATAPTPRPALRFGMEFPVTHAVTHAGGAFEIRQDGRRIAWISYARIDADRVVAEHTVIDPSLRGHGVAAVLLDAAIAWARLTGTTLDATCAYVRGRYAKDPSLETPQRPESAPVRVLQGHIKDQIGRAHV